MIFRSIFIHVRMDPQISRLIARWHKEYSNCDNRTSSGMKGDNSGSPASARVLAIEGRLLQNGKNRLYKVVRLFRGRSATLGQVLDLKLKLKLA